MKSIPCMRALLATVTLALGLALLGTGCHSSPKLDTSLVESSFQTSGADVKTEALKIVETAKATQYQEALTAAQALVAKGKLSSDEDSAMQDLIGQLEKLAAKAKK